jgi:hypothetical protein
MENTFVQFVSWVNISTKTRYLINYVIVIPNLATTNYLNSIEYTTFSVGEFIS